MIHNKAKRAKHGFCNIEKNNLLVFEGGNSDFGAILAQISLLISTDDLNIIFIGKREFDKSLMQDRKNMKVLSQINRDDFL